MSGSGSSCTRCADGWVCEQHPDQPWPHPSLDEPDGQCVGPGMLCDCSAGMALARTLDAKYRPQHSPAANDAVFLELLAPCEALATATERSIASVHTLAEAHVEGRRPSDAALTSYLRIAERAQNDLAQFRTLVAAYKSQIRTH